MKGGVQTAAAIGVGYILGRRRKMRLATMLAVGAATGGAARLGPAALRQGTKYLGKTDVAGSLGPQVSQIVETVRGDLLDAAKGAATAAVTNRIDSLSDSLHDRAETLRNPKAAVGKAGDTAGKATGKAGETAGKLVPMGRGRRQASEEQDEYDEPADEYEDEEDLDEAPAEDEAEETDEPLDDEADEPLDDEADEPDESRNEEDDDEAPPRRRRTTRSPIRARR